MVRRRLSTFALAALVAGTVAAPLRADEPGPSFADWLADFRREAAAQGIGAATLEATLTGLEPVQRVIELDQSQPEFTQTFWGYLDKRVTEERIRRGRDLLKKHRSLLDRVQAKYGVQPWFLVAFWGLETNFGDFVGKMPTVASLATLAWDRRRSDFFRKQLLALLGLIDAGDLEPDVAGSWAGALGQPQFMPTTYRDFAVDGDGDSRRDLWGSLPDVFASAANYLGRSGWQSGYTWGREVTLPKGLDLDLTGLGTRKTLAEWQRLGVRRIEGGALPAADIEASVVLPAGVEGPAFLVYKNFGTIMVWNRSLLYALAVGHLADRIAGKGRFLSPRPAVDRPMARADMLRIQELLTRLGFDAGETDGIAGSQTQAAIRAFQRKARLPADGYPDYGLLERLQTAAGGG